MHKIYYPPLLGHRCYVAFMLLRCGFIFILYFFFFFTCSPSFPSYLIWCPVVEQCICNRIQADEMVLEWVAYSTTKNGLKLTTDTLEQFEHEVTETLFQMIQDLFISHVLVILLF